MEGGGGYIDEWRSGVRWGDGGQEKGKRFRWRIGRLGLVSWFV